MDFPACSTIFSSVSTKVRFRRWATFFATVVLPVPINPVMTILRSDVVAKAPLHIVHRQVFQPGLTQTCEARFHLLDTITTELIHEFVGDHQRHHCLADGHSTR